MRGATGTEESGTELEGRCGDLTSSVPERERTFLANASYTRPVSELFGTVIFNIGTGARSSVSRRCGMTVT
eukprot:9476987-Pyramimonas_sp.AAC.1